MLTYNSKMRRLILPEYGRNIQNMVDHCLSLDTPEERQQCAEAIIRAMKIIVPCTGDPSEYERKLWDHLQIMSGFALDVESPYGYPDMSELDGGPDPMPTVRPTNMPYRHYGLILTQLIETAAGMEPGEARDELVVMLANQMKKTMLAYNKDGVEDERIFNDLFHISHGAIRIEPDTLQLHEYQQAAVPTSKRKRKKK